MDRKGLQWPLLWLLWDKDNVWKGGRAIMSFNCWEVQINCRTQDLIFYSFLFTIAILSRVNLTVTMSWMYEWANRYWYNPSEVTTPFAQLTYLNQLLGLGWKIVPHLLVVNGMRKNWTKSSEVPLYKHWSSRIVSASSLIMMSWAAFYTQSCSPGVIHSSVQFTQQQNCINFTALNLNLFLPAGSMFCIVDAGLLLLHSSVQFTQHQHWQKVWSAASANPLLHGIYSTIYYHILQL